MELEEILRERAKIFDRAVNGNLAPREPKRFYEALRWIPLSGGKRLRPILTMLACEAVGGIPEKTVPFGIALEYLHNSTLIHDDIIDGDKWRRGLATTNDKFGLAFAILAGDALIGETYQMLSYLAPPDLNAVTFKEIIRSIADAAKRFYEGEALDIEYADRFDVEIPEYIKMIEYKTGQLYLLACKGGALIGKGSRKQVDNLAEYGRLFGIMFQIKDDLLNILTEQTALGKQSIGSDILNGKRTLMVIHAFSHTKPSQKKMLKQILGNPKSTQKEILKVIEILHNVGSIAYTEKILEQLKEQSLQTLTVLKESESKELLRQLIEYSITRIY